MGARLSFLRLVSQCRGVRERSEEILERIDFARSRDVRAGLLSYADRRALVLLHPGWVQTAMGGPNAAMTPKDSVSGMRGVIDRLTPADNGRFINFDGAPIPW
jgi:hypothetical protein